MKHLLTLVLIFCTLSLWGQSAKQFYKDGLNNNNLEQQVILFTQAIEKDPKYILAYHRRADAYKELKQYKKALADYNTIISMSPKDPFKYYARGLLYLEQKNYITAEQDFTSAIKLKNDYEDFYYYRAICLMELNKFNQALKDFEKLQTPELKNRISFYKGRVNFKLYNYDVAEEIFKGLLTDKLYAEDAKLYLARIEINKEKFDEGIALLSQIINQNSKNEKALFLRANALKEVGLYESAIEDYTTLIALNPDYTYYNKRGLIYEQLEKWKDAETDYSKAIKGNPKWSISYNNRGYSRMKMGNFQDAKNDFEISLKNKPIAPTTAINYAGYYWYVKKDKKNMYKYLDYALKYNFKDKDSLYDEKKKGWLFKGINNTLEFRTFIEGQ